VQPVQAPDGPPAPYALRSAPSVGFSFGCARTAILDTDYILNQVARLVEDPVGALALLGPAFGRERTFASSHVLTELCQADKLGYQNKWEKLAAQAHERGIARSPRDYQDMFESTARPLITFVDVTGMFQDDAATKAVRATDRKDAATAQLALLLSRTRPLVYSHDHSLWRPGLAPQPASFQAVIAAGWQADSGETTLKGAAYVGFGAIWAVDGAARSVAGVLKIPDWLTRVTLIGGVVLLLVGKERRDKILNFLAPAGRFVLSGLEQASTAMALLADSAAQVQPDDRLECRVAEVLSRHPSDTALLAREVHEDLPYQLQSAPGHSVGDVRAVLRTYPCFVEGPRHRFRLGVSYESHE
jgi:hypothetical protein